MARTAKITKINVSLIGLTPIMFNRYPGDNKTKFQPWEKFYLDSQHQLVFPARNLESFLSAQNTYSASKHFFDKREYKSKSMAIRAFTLIEPENIPFTREGTVMAWKEFGDFGTYVDHDVARMKNGVPNKVDRPVIPLPWQLDFQLTLYPNDAVESHELRTLFDECGVQLGIGANRGRYGKFSVARWETLVC